MSFDSDFAWQRTFLPEIKRVCANYLIGEAPVEEDMRRNTDLGSLSPTCLVLRLDPVRVACRIRRNKYAHSPYLDQFTIRSGRPRDVQTEHAKVLSGWGDYIFYGFADPADDSLAAWVLGDLSEFRLWHHRRLATGRKPWVEEKTNGDGSSSFMAFRIDDLPADFVLARKQIDLVTKAG
jgi:hypothetical protein